MILESACKPVHEQTKGNQNNSNCVVSCILSARVVFVSKKTHAEYYYNHDKIFSNAISSFSEQNAKQHHKYWCCCYQINMKYWINMENFLETSLHLAITLV